ncbi:hypothetical protein Htur_4405 (plasmid) [Haloterrigena turkmenica DSM 5511]|uniref:Uncharacterized protein n=1 Tax=Haloterrigena turkmenica (strain ATCC 51198 / DSM 5511 / JCM 9101 / NCIMB 13204 / VKM B-1734 / 4k) TaxID=543526 RepID=D2S1G9_HALTV|nr:hypothetical protein Htur_4405 [Haloterrigena turkmenica DSM 5511]
MKITAISVTNTSIIIPKVDTGSRDRVLAVIKRRSQSTYGEESGIDRFNRYRIDVLKEVTVSGELLNPFDTLKQESSE